jgi:glc operon protein GlcG
MPLTLQEAQAVITGAHERAAKLAALVTVAVVDEGGHLQALGRMSGAAPLSARIAETKAASVALFRRDGAALRQMQEANPGFFAQLDRAVRVPILAGAGAALILRGDTVLGAVAVSGGMMPGQDDECAEAALAALAPEPVVLPGDPRIGRLPELSGWAGLGTDYAVPRWWLTLSSSNACRCRVAKLCTGWWPACLACTSPPRSFDSPDQRDKRRELRQSHSH